MRSVIRPRKPQKWLWRAFPRWIVSTERGCGHLHHTPSSIPRDFSRRLITFTETDHQSIKGVSLMHGSVNPILDLSESILKLFILLWLYEEANWLNFIYGIYVTYSGMFFLLNISKWYADFLMSVLIYNQGYFSYVGWMTRKKSIFWSFYMSGI